MSESADEIIDGQIATLKPGFSTRQQAVLYTKLEGAKSVAMHEFVQSTDGRWYRRIKTVRAKF